MYYTYNGQDVKNLQNKRNVRNTPKRNYNCGGYALNTFSWLCPYPQKMHNDLFNGWLDYDLEEAQELCAKWIERNFRNYECITEEEVNNYKNTEVVAFRCGKYDFHFIVRKRNGIWYEKMGAKNKIDIVPKEEVFSSCWYGSGYNYRSKIAFFAKIA